MKRYISVFILSFLLVGSVNAGLYIFNPDPVDLYDLDHGYYYEWGINHDFTGETIYDARLVISNINNWRQEDNSLFIHLLDNVTSGVYAGIDADPTINNYFNGQGVHIDTYVDGYAGPLGDWVTLTYDFSDLGIVNDFVNYAIDGNFGFGFDPDCHFFNDKIQLMVVTDAPEPGTLVLFAVGLIGCGILRKKFPG